MSRAVVQSPIRTLFLSLLSALLYVLAFPNFNQSALAWVALVPLSLMAASSSPRQAFRWGWLSGTLAYSGLLAWIITTFHAAHLSVPLAVLSLALLAGYLGLYWGAWALSLTYCSFGPGPKEYSGAFLGAAAWVALEYLRTYLFSGFPWGLLGDSQVKILPLIQVASITGVYGVSFLIVLVTLSIAQWRLKPLALSLGLIALTWFYGTHRLAQYAHEPTGQGIKVALLQGSIDQYKKWDNAYVADIQRSYEALVTEAVQSHPDLILWPETSVPGFLLQDPPLRAWLQKIVLNSHTAHLAGAPVIHDERIYNSAFSINPEGRIEGEYAKHHLVPFGEVVPWSGVLGKFIRVLNDLGGFTAGKGSAVMTVAGYPIGVNICYEAIFPNLVRRSVAEGAELIANMTNDGWYMKTAAPYQHWAPNIFRAIENDRWLIRADNTGISGIIKPTGEVLATSTLFKPCVIQGIVHERKERTFYTRFGDVFAWMCCLICVLLLIRNIGLPARIS